MDSTERTCDIGMIGLAVMGQNLALNMADHDFRVCVYNRTQDVTDDFVQGAGSHPNIRGAHTLEGLVTTLKPPRRVMMMIKAGSPVDEMIEQLLPLLSPGDILIDGGNSHFLDTIRRTRLVEERGLRYIGTGISGGEEGARHGPSIMPGGSPDAWPHVKDIFQSIAAKVEDGTPACDWVGSDGAGHFVKMVHNGIEYGDMQLIAESYHLMRSLLNLSYPDMHRVFSEWNRDKLNSYLIEITADIMAFKDDDGEPLIEKILDSAGQKGTGRWASISALDTGTPLTLITEAVQARSLSALKDERVAASKRITGPQPDQIPDAGSFLSDLFDALYAAKIISYTQGFMLMRAAAGDYSWDLDYGSIAHLWRAGCIIRSAFLKEIEAAYQRDPGLSNLLLDPYFNAEIAQAQPGWRRVVSAAVLHGIPVPAMASALTFLDGYRSARLPANLIQAQRDYFGAHTYERIDRPANTYFHTDWTGHGGEITAGSYQA